MSGIHVYNRKNEQHVGECNIPIYRPNILSNPFTHIKDKKTKASYIVKDRDTAINMYSNYFDTMYGSNYEFTKEIDRIYELYKSGKDVYLECYCHPLKCHGDIIAEKLLKRLVKEKIKSIYKK